MKKYTHLYINFLCLLALLIFGVSEVWGYTWIARVGVNKGKGAVKIQIYNNAVNRKKVVVESGVATQLTGLQNCTTTVSLGTTNGWPICVVVQDSTGYTFEGWYDSGGTRMSGDRTYNTNGKWSGDWTKIYYAKFTANSYDVTLNANGGKESDQLVSATYDSAMPSKIKNTNNSIVAPTRDGYTFLGYFDSQSGGTKYYNANLTSAKKWDKAEAKTLYAHWQENTYTITWPTIASGLVYTPGEVVQNHWATTGSAVDGTTSVPGTFSCNEVLEPAKNSTGYTVTFTPSNTAKYLSKTKTIKQNVAKANQTITWDLIPNREYATGTLMNATATSAIDGLQITYSSDKEDWGKINENNRLVVVEPNKTIIITAHQSGNDNWNPVDSTKTIITLGANPNQYTDVHASNITYGDLLGVSELSGKVYLDEVEIAGELEWVDPMIMPNAGTANHMVLFTPNNQVVYSPVYFEVPVKVDKANPVLKWNISNALREKTKYSHFVTSSNPNSVLDISIPDGSKDYLNYTAGILTVDSITKNADGTKSPVSGKKIHVHQDASDNYNAIDLDYNVTVYPKADQCLPVDISVAADTTKIQNMGAAYIGSHEWCKRSGNVDTTYLIANVKYSLYNGIQLGRWDEGLTPLKQKLEKMGFLEIITGKPIEVAIEAINAGLPGTPKSIELAFTGVPESLSFDTKLQTVIFDLSGEKTANQQDPKWFVYQKSINGIETVIDSFPAYTTTSIQVPLESTTRAVRIELRSAFAGFIQNLTISKKQYIRAEETPATFGNGKPLQAPQKLKISYSSIGSCDIPYDTILVSTDPSAFFYVDKDMIISNVGLDHIGMDSVFVRCTDVNKSGHVIFRAKNTGVELSVPVSSVSAPTISASPANIVFQTGTEHAPATNSDYRALKAHDFSNCFSGSQALFDTLYVYGVSESDTMARQWEYDARKKYNVPAIGADTGNVYTPCFVFAKNGNKYDYFRTYDAAKNTLNISANDKKLGFIGYKPANLTQDIPAVQINGNAGIYLDSVEMIAKKSVFAISDADTIHARGNNKLTSVNAAAVQLASSSTELTIEDSWTGDAVSGKLALISASSYPSIDLGSANGSVIINGLQLELHNANHMAIAHMVDLTEKEDGSVLINDGTILGADTLGMPLNTIIDGGTFNDGTIQCYTNKGTARRPWNSRGDLLARTSMAKEALPTWYGKSHLTLDGSKKVNPMLQDESICIFHGENSTNALTPENWNKYPERTSDVQIRAHMVVSDTLTFKSLILNGGDTVSVTVAPNAGLTIGAGGVLGATTANLTLKAGTEGTYKGQTGFLRISPESKEDMPEAKIEFFSTAYYTKTDPNTNNRARYQCVGAPISESLPLKSVFPAATYIYTWNEKDEAWINSRTSMDYKPFLGYETSQKKNANGYLFEYKGHLVSGSDIHVIDLSCSAKEKGYNLLANSFTAPIVISKFNDDDFVNAEQTIFILNAGTKAQSVDQKTKSDEIDAPGKWFGIPVKSSKELDEDLPCIIPSMQGFWIKATPGEGKAQLKLDYSRLAWGVSYKDSLVNKPLRAPKRYEEELPVTGKLKIAVYSEEESDCLFMLKSESYDVAFDNGYDAHKISSEGLEIFAIEDNEELFVDATNNFVGTQIGVRTSAETAYTLLFSRLRGENELALLDKETDNIIEINEGTEYSFFAEPNRTITERFEIVAREKAPEIATGVDNTKNGVKVHKFIKDNQLYILKNGVLYNAMGVVVER